jgi:Ca2+-binding RTX toxin-like protein
VSGNSAGTNGGGIQNNDTATLASSIVIGNTATSGPDCLDGTAGGLTSAGFNVVGDGTGCPSDGTDDVTAPDASFLGQLANNGGPTETHTIAAGSPPVGRAADDPACNGTTRDQRGVSRPNNGCDAGAYELRECQGVVINVVGTNGKNNLTGTPGPDGIIGEGGNDRVSGGGGNDGVCGGTGNDRLAGGSGRDRLSGGNGNDNLGGGPGRDTCTGGPGRDRFTSCETRRQ